MKKWWLYFVIGVILWFLVDFSTTPAIKNPLQYYSNYMPVILVFYLGYPALFSFLIYKTKLNNLWFFIASIIAMLIIEVVFTKNSLLWTYPIMLIAIPAGIGVYSLLTFFPKWIVEKDIKSHKWIMFILILIWLFLCIASVLG